MENFIRENINTSEDVLLAGLGRILPKLPPEQIKTFIAKVQRERSRKSTYSAESTKGQKHLIASLNSLSIENQRAIVAGNASFGEASYYFVKDITGGSNIIDFIKSSDDKAVGKTNLEEGGIMTSAEDASISRVELDWYNGTETNLKNAQFVPYDVTGTNVIPALNNSELELWVNGSMQFRLPLSDFIETEGKSGTVANGVNLSKNVIIKAGDKIQYNLYVPDSLSITDGTNNIYLRTKLKGDKIKPKQ